jgi:hypothetical protein
VGSVVANDGIFFIPAEYIQELFSRVYLGYYNENWYHASVTNTGANPSSKAAYTLYLDNPVDQEVVISFDHTAPR